METKRYKTIVMETKRYKTIGKELPLIRNAIFDASHTKSGNKIIHPTCTLASFEILSNVNIMVGSILCTKCKYNFKTTISFVLCMR